MKLIIAMIQPERLYSVREALERTDTPLICTREVLDLAEQSAEMHRGSQYGVAPVKMRLEVLVTDDSQVDDAVRAIADVAGAGGSKSYGKGNIVVLAVEQWIPIRESLSGQAAAA